jgi:hypothetical protein
MHTAMKTMLKTNNSVRHLPLAQLEGRGEGRAFAQQLRNSCTNVRPNYWGRKNEMTNMNLQSLAENESPRKTRSKLEAHREAIFALRRKHWTYRQIAQWLNAHGVPVTFPSVYRFCERAIARRPRGNIAADSAKEKPIFITTPQTATNKITNQYRFNLDI